MAYLNVTGVFGRITAVAGCTDPAALERIGKGTLKAQRRVPALTVNITTAFTNPAALERIGEANAVKANSTSRKLIDKWKSKCSSPPPLHSC